MPSDHYFHRFRKRLSKELGDFVKTQFVLTVLIVWGRCEHHTRPNIRANVSSFVWPYLMILGGFTVYHFCRTAYLLIERLSRRLVACKLNWPI